MPSKKNKIPVSRKLQIITSLVDRTHLQYPSGSKVAKQSVKKGCIFILKNTAGLNIY